jgi:hypothetical protein
LKSSVTSSSLVLNSFNFSINVQSIQEINSTTNKDHAFGGIRGGQPIIHVDDIERIEIYKPCSP